MKTKVKEGLSRKDGSFCLYRFSTCRYEYEKDKERKDTHTQTLSARKLLRQRWQPLLFGQQGQAPAGFLGKIMLAGGSGIFPENLALPEAAADKPL